MVAGSSYRLHSRPVTLDFTCHWDYLPDYLAGVASQTLVFSKEGSQYVWFEQSTLRHLGNCCRVAHTRISRLAEMGSRDLLDRLGHYNIGRQEIGGLVIQQGSTYRVFIMRRCDHQVLNNG